MILKIFYICILVILSACVSTQPKDNPKDIDCLSSEYSRNPAAALPCQNLFSQNKPTEVTDLKSFGKANSGNVVHFRSDVGRWPTLKSSEQFQKILRRHFDWQHRSV